LEEIDHVAPIPDTTKDLNHPYAADDLGAAKVNAFEAIPVRHSTVVINFS